MSISVSSYNYSGPRKRKGRVTEENRFRVFGTTLKIAMPFCIFFGAAILRVMLTSQSETLNKETISLENRISDIERETDNTTSTINKSLLSIGTSDVVRSYNGSLAACVGSKVDGLLPTR